LGWPGPAAPRGVDRFPHGAQHGISWGAVHQRGDARILEQTPDRGKLAPSVGHRRMGSPESAGAGGTAGGARLSGSGGAAGTGPSSTPETSAAPPLAFRTPVTSIR